MSKPRRPRITAEILEALDEAISCWLLEYGPCHPLFEIMEKARSYVTCMQMFLSINRANRKRKLLGD